MDIDGGGFAQEAMDNAEVEKLFPIANQGAAKDDLGDVFGPDEIADGVGDAASFQADRAASRSGKIGNTRSRRASCRTAMTALLTATRPNC